MRPRGEPKRIIPVKLDKELAERIEEMAKLMGEGKSVVMRQAMRLGLAEMEASRRAESARKTAGLAGPVVYPPARPRKVDLNEV